MANRFTGKTKGEASEATQNDETQASGGTEATENPAPKPADGEAKKTKSIVPAKYAGKYKDPSNDDALRTFIKEQCYVNGKVDLDKFYALCLANGVDAAQVDKYKAMTHRDIGGKPAPVPGSAGRAVMTLRNLMSTVARKGEGMKGLDGKTYDVKIAKAALTGAAAEAASKTEPATAETSESKAA